MRSGGRSRRARRPQRARPACPCAAWTTSRIRCVDAPRKAGHRQRARLRRVRISRTITARRRELVRQPWLAFERRACSWRASCLFDPVRMAIAMTTYGYFMADDQGSARLEQAGGAGVQT